MLLDQLPRVSVGRCPVAGAIGPTVPLEENGAIRSSLPIGEMIASGGVPEQQLLQVR